jgi:hypothetical protein
MFGAFERNFKVDPERVPDPAGASAGLGAPSLNELIARFGGASFNRGLYRIMRASDAAEWNVRIALAFPAHTNQTICFGYDWLGRVFALDGRRLEQGQPGVVMFEPGTGDALEIPANLLYFHDNELVQDADPALAINAHQKWLADGGAVPTYKECVGYKIPLFLGGADEFENMELSDLDVYWHLMGQLIVKVRDLPPGTPVRITIG